MDIGQKIREIRESKGWTQSELSKISGITPEGISNIENGRKAPRCSTLQKLAKAFEITYDELIADNIELNTSNHMSKLNKIYDNETLEWLATIENKEYIEVMMNLSKHMTPKGAKMFLRLLEINME